MNTPGYESLADVLIRAYTQAAKGKGAERHATDKAFHEQPMQSISELLGSHTGLTYQAMKKIQESQRMGKEAAVRELLGAINYCAGAIIFLEREDPGAPKGPELEWPDIIKDVAWHCDHGIPGCVGMVVPHGEQCPTCRTKELERGVATPLWACTHGIPGGDYAVVPIGEACKVCFATK